MENKQITPNFSLKEWMEGSNMPIKAIRMNYQDFDEAMMPTVKHHLNSLQYIRNCAKQEFGDKFKGLKITAGLRVKRWELLQGRSGNGYHPKYCASDIIPICDDEDYMEIFDWVFETFQDTWTGGFAKKEPVIKNGKVVKTGFIHIDNRGFKVRWTY